MSDATSDLTGELRATLEAFLAAIDRADATALAPLWCADASMYFPFANTPELHRGSAAVLARFERMFADLRARNPGPSYVGFTVESFECVPLDARHVLVLAMLRFANQRGRRSIVFRREAAGWRLLHVHGSNVGPPPGAGAARAIR